MCGVGFGSLVRSGYCVMYAGFMCIYMHVEVRGQLWCHSSELSLFLETGSLIGLGVHC